MTLLTQAIQMASIAHLHQFDKGGHSYILHPLRIMMRLRTTDEELMAIAVLHDVVVDGGVSFDDLTSMGMSPRVVEAVKALTRQNGETYEQFIERLSGRRDALLVKREDLRDNSDITRLKGVTDKDIARTKKYMLAMTRVEKMLKNLNQL